MTRGRWGPPAGRGRRGCYSCRRDMRPADSPAGPTLSGRGRGKGLGSDEAEDALLDSVGQIGAVLDRALDLRLGLLHLRGEALGALLELATALTQFALKAHAGFADLALETVAGGRAAAL